MAHHCDYVDRIEIECDYETERRYLVRVVNASWKEYSLDVMREIEANVLVDEPRFYYRNIEYCNMGGYLVKFPGEVYRQRYSLDKYIVKLDDWTDCRAQFQLWCKNKLDERSKKNIIELYPEFEYVLKKMNPDDQRIDRVMQILETWKEHPEIEGLIALGMYDVANNKNLFRLTLPKRKQIIQWICKNAKNGKFNPKYIKLKDIQGLIKNKMTIEEYEDYKKSNIGHYGRGRYGTRTWTMADVESYRYLKKKYPVDYTSRNIINYYYDYLDMCKRAGHNLKDPYWKFPSDMYKQHDKVAAELENMAKSAEGLQGEYLKAIMQPLADKFNAEVDGYKIFIPTEYEDIKKQCDVLYQCLIRNNYVNNVIQQDEILVFIWDKENNPIATAQVYYDKKLGQFYADERGHSSYVRFTQEQTDHFNKVYLEEEKLIDAEDEKNYKAWFVNSCKPDIKVHRAFMKWLDMFEPFKVKADRTKKYYKGFHSRDALGVYHTSFGDFSFEVGHTYCTPFDDKIIAEKGGQGVVSTNMVFHFCDSIQEISKHYNPTCYAEVEPVGVVVEHCGALLSNKIKIVRELSDEEVKQILAQESKYNELRVGGYM